MNYREADKLCDDEGLVITCWSPLEIEMMDGSIATGSAAQLILDHLEQLAKDQNERSD